MQSSYRIEFVCTLGVSVCDGVGGGGEGGLGVAWGTFSVFNFMCTFGVPFLITFSFFSSRSLTCIMKGIMKKPALGCQTTSGVSRNVAVYQFQFAVISSRNVSWDLTNLTAVSYWAFLIFFLICNCNISKSFLMNCFRFFVSSQSVSLVRAFSVPMDSVLPEVNAEFFKWNPKCA